MIQIITDSTSDLGNVLTEKYHLEVVPLQVIIAEQTYRDGIDIHPKKLFEMVDRFHELPKTSAASIIDFSQVFEKSSESIYIGISNQLSCSVQNAELASQNFPNKEIRVIDSWNLTNGIGLMVLRAAELRDQGQSIEKIESTIFGMRSKIRTSFVLNTLEYLHKGGRCTAMQSIVGSILKIRPVIHVRGDGTLGVKEKIRGNRLKTLQALLDDLKTNKEIIDRDRIFIPQVECRQDAEFVANEINDLLHPKEIIITEAGCVVSSHCGPGTLGVSYCLV